MTKNMVLAVPAEKERKRAIQLYIITALRQLRRLLIVTIFILFYLFNFTNFIYIFLTSNVCLMQIIIM